MKITTLKDAEEALAQFVFSEGRELYTLGRMRRLMDIVGNPQNRLKVVHVAGTAGKTSTSYFIAKMLQLSGKTVGLTVSPHISSVTERVELGGKPLPENEFCKLLTEFLSIEGVVDLQPRYFEVLVGFAFWVFDRKNVDYAVIEVGLGGLLDGTNVVDRSDKVCVITDIDFDHTHILGKTLEKIAYQKAGIILPKNEVFMLEQPEKVVSTIRKSARKQRANLHILRQELAPAGLPAYQQRNWSLARQVYDFVMERDGLENVDLNISNWAVPGRMEKIGNVILDGAHNPSKLRALVTSLKQQNSRQKYSIILGMIETKETYINEAMELLKPLTVRMLCVPAHADQDIPHKPLDPELLAEVAKKAGINHVRALPTLKRAIEDCANDKAVIITGSLYLLGPAKELLLAYAKV